MPAHPLADVTCGNPAPLDSPSSDIPLKKRLTLGCRTVPTIPSEIEALWIINIPENNSLETEPAFLVRITLSVLAYITNRLYSNVRGL